MKIPFDIKFRPQIESGEYKLITRQGGYAEILKWDLLGDRHILAVVETEYDESPFKYWPDGHIVSGIDENYDLFIITPEPELSEFEKAVAECMYAGCDIEGMIEVGTCIETIRHISAELLELARKEALKDLPRWKKKEEEKFGYYCSCGFLVSDGYEISIAELKRKLPGFKED